ncbi:hypothetical protein [Desulfovibrio desulfuricans]|uniref:hypothetical protein n=1 Tax=Desulfovibrio desulfuricans TaxID=876 RepID=UPI0035B1BC43
MDTGSATPDKGCGCGSAPGDRQYTQQDNAKLSTSHSTPPMASCADADSPSAGRKGLAEGLSDNFVSRNGNTLCILPVRPEAVRG